MLNTGYIAFMRRKLTLRNDSLFPFPWINLWSRLFGVFRRLFCQIVWSNCLIGQHRNLVGQQKEHIWKILNFSKLFTVLKLCQDLNCQAGLMLFFKRFLCPRDFTWPKNCEISNSGGIYSVKLALTIRSNIKEQDQPPTPTIALSVSPSVRHVVTPSNALACHMDGRHGGAQSTKNKVIIRPWGFLQLHFSTLQRSRCGFLGLQVAVARFRTGGRLIEACRRQHLHWAFCLGQHLRVIESAWLKLSHRHHPCYLLVQKVCAI